MENLFGKTLTQLQKITEENNWPAYTASQLARWIYVAHTTSIDEMTNISAKIRETLKEQYHILVNPPQREHTSIDGTKKYLFELHGPHYIETAYIPEKSRHTLCVSSQAGCKMGCTFCMTARQGFSKNLTAAEILNQYRSVPEHPILTNIVYMGMGEPLDNIDAVNDSLDILTSSYGYSMSPRRITVSTIGLLPYLSQFLMQSKCNLAVSLHSPFAEERRLMVPVEKTHPIKNILNEIRNFDIERQRRISFEYIVCKNWNHSSKHVNELARQLNGIRCRINLIPYHPIPGSSFIPPELSDLEIFRSKLNAKGIVTTVRKSRGQDIQAACGLLSTLERSGRVGLE